MLNLQSNIAYRVDNSKEQTSVNMIIRIIMLLYNYHMVGAITSTGVVINADW